MAALTVLWTSALVSYALFRQDYASSYVLPFVLSVALQFFGLAIYHLLIYPYFLSPTRHLPGPKVTGWKILGHTLEILSNPAGVPQIDWIKIPNKGLVRFLGPFNQDHIILATPEALKEVLHQKCYSFEKPQLFRDGIGRILGLRGLLFTEHDEHKRQRKIILPAFAHGHIKSIVPIFWKKTRELMEKFDNVIEASSPRDDGTAVVDVARWISLATLDIIGEAGFGYKFRALESANLEGSNMKRGEGGSELAYAYRTVFSQSLQARILTFSQFVFPRWFIQNIPIKRNSDVHECTKIIKKVSLKIIHRKKQELQDRKLSKLSAEKGADTDTDTSEKDILGVMLQSGNFDAPSDEEILRDQMMTFLAAGHETTASATVWALYLLSRPKYHAIQSRLREEIHTTFPLGLPESVTYDEIESMKYMRQVTSEVLRFYPPVGSTMRVSTEDSTVLGEFIPKGTWLNIAPWAINKCAAFWGEDAEEFKPERWGEDSGGIDSNYAFMTFLAGPRGCIGAQFSRVEFKCLLAGIVGRYFIDEEKGVEIDTSRGVTARPNGGMPLSFKAVEGW
ncbi:hypothetical protein RUND412_007511 [Rhizina undulata]